MSDSDFEDKLNERLRASRDDLDAATLSRLNQARQRALDEMPSARTRAISGGRWLSAGAVAAAALFAVLLWRGNVPPPGIPELPQEIATAANTPDSMSLEMELLLSDEELEMFEELEFYAALTDAELGATG